VYRNRGAAYRQKEDTDFLLKAVADFQKYLDLGGGTKYGDQERVKKTIAEIKETLGKNWKNNFV
jgi:hypothetical protein